MTLYSVRDSDGNTLWFTSKKAAKRHQIDHNRADRKAAKEYKKNNKTDGDYTCFLKNAFVDPIIHKVDNCKSNMFTFLNSQTGG